MHTTTRLGLDVLDGTDGVNTTPTVDAQAKGILDNAVLVTEGTLVSRPAANTVEKDHIYKATDLNQWYISDGTNWNTFDVYGAGGAVSRGAVSIATSQSTSSTSYTTLGTPDQVTGIMLPANGLIRVWYAATWQESVAGAARAAIFIGSNQLQVPAGQSLNNQGPTAQAAAINQSTTAVNHPLMSAPFGLASLKSGGAGAYSGDVTTGQALAVSDANGTATIVYDVNGLVSAPAGSSVGGPCDIDNLSAGTYTISVQFKCSSGSVTASNRRLRVQALSFT